MTPHSRARGALIGLAVGDALGTTLEFQPKNTDPHREMVTDIVGGGPFHLPAGYYTDDTAMAYALGDSLRRYGYDPRRQAEAYVAWMRHGKYDSTGKCFDIGNTVRDALHRFEQTGDPYAGSTDPHTAGNGSLMRLAPVAIYFNIAADVIFHSGDQSRVTHGAPQAVSACRYFGGLLYGAIHGATKGALLSPLYHPAGEKWDDLHPAIAEIARGSFQQKEEADIRASGYVVHTLEAALWAFYRTDTFADGAILAVNLREDADTTGAVYGQIAGAYYGYEGIPAGWRAKLRFHDDLLALADELWAAVL